MDTNQFNCEKNDEVSLTKAVEDSIASAVSLIPENLPALGDEARYFMIELDLEQRQARILLTSDDKKTDGPKVVKLALPHGEPTQLEATLKFAAKDYLTTCSEFLNYALLAVIHSGDRSKTQLL
ncbi:MAG: hypothetical protein MI976_19535 [Pseudomonadales bacterium]|nr:hypothetical protein [Pseudomonadales bacterium]